MNNTFRGVAAALVVTLVTGCSNIGAVRSDDHIQASSKKSNDYLPGSDRYGNVVAFVVEVYPKNKTSEILEATAKACPSLSGEVEKLQNNRLAKVHWVSPSILVGSSNYIVVVPNGFEGNIKAGSVVGVNIVAGCEGFNRIVNH